ncbi:MAG: hypothetical protein D6807_03020 [Alphaproteobacteria bacterium]|nr:MAG: hypothetical protein D6807_03020 [Alphaproteobacteria bacterium]
MAKTGWTSRRRRLFLDALRASANVSAAARRAGMSRSAAYALRQSDASFRAQWDDALEEALDALEEELRRRALEGVEKPVFYGGKPCGTIRSYSDQLGMFLLKCRRPAVFSTHGASATESSLTEEVAGARAELGARLARLADSCSAEADGES